MAHFYQELQTLLTQGKSAAVATIIESRGSTPREEGAKMIALEEGRIVGSVGGGCGEGQVMWDVRAVLQLGTPRICRVNLTGEITDESATNCGGIMDIFVERVRPDDVAASGLTLRQVVDRAVKALEQRETILIATVVASPGPDVPAGTKVIVERDGSLMGCPWEGSVRERFLSRALLALTAGRSQRIVLPLDEEKRGDFFLEVIAPSPELLIVGAGHIAVPLSRMGKVMEFEITVVDDRASFANRERFPEADRVLLGKIETVLQHYPIGASSYVVLVTRGHQLDEAALRLVLTRETAYIGMIGSKRRVRAVFAHLEKVGCARERLAQVHAPIGLDIGAETPAEIAASIIAEIVAVRRKRRASFLSEKRLGRAPASVAEDDPGSPPPDE